jgi:[acyl-carrier-protein] S-malonyltransferase
VSSTALAFLFPGQGSQYVGMGKAFFEAYPSARARFEEASEILKKDFARLCFEDPDSTLIQTDNVQPAITLVSVVALDVLREEGYVAGAVAGHSVGEYAALCAAGVLSFADTMRVIQVRSRAMKLAAERHPGGMSAVLGLDPDAVSAICTALKDAALKDAGSVEIANYNTPVQAVLTGDSNTLQQAADLAKKRGAKLVVPLKVSGPWHSRFMAEAQGPLRDALADSAVHAPAIPIIANTTAVEYSAEPQAIRDALVAQIASPVLWSQSMARLVSAGHRVFVEVGPGKVLSGLFRDISRDVKVMNVQDTESLEKFRAARAALSAC